MTVELLQSGYVQRNFGAVLDSVLSGTATVIQRYSRKLAVIISYDEYERLKDLENKFLWAESKRIADKNDREGTWVDGSVVEERMRKLRALEN